MIEWVSEVVVHGLSDAFHLCCGEGRCFPWYHGCKRGRTDPRQGKGKARLQLRYHHRTTVDNSAAMTSTIGAAAAGGERTAASRSSVMGGRGRSLSGQSQKSVEDSGGDGSIWSVQEGGVRAAQHSLDVDCRQNKRGAAAGIVVIVSLFVILAVFAVMFSTACWWCCLLVLLLLLKSVVVLLHL